MHTVNDYPKSGQDTPEKTKVAGGYQTTTADINDASRIISFCPRIKSLSLYVMAISAPMFWRSV